MRVSCSVPIESCDDKFLDDIRALGINPIITPILVRAIYQGTNNELGISIADLFQSRRGCEIFISYGNIKKPTYHKKK